MKLEQKGFRFDKILPLPRDTENIGISIVRGGLGSSFLEIKQWKRDSALSLLVLTVMCSYWH